MVKFPDVTTSPSHKLDNHPFITLSIRKYSFVLTIISQKETICCTPFLTEKVQRSFSNKLNCVMKFKLFPFTLIWYGNCPYGRYTEFTMYVWRGVKKLTYMWVWAGGGGEVLKLNVKSFPWEDSRLSLLIPSQKISESVVCLSIKIWSTILFHKIGETIKIDIPQLDKITETTGSHLVNYWLRNKSG